MISAPDKHARSAIRRLCRANYGVVRTSQALAAGVHPRELYAMRDSGFLQPLARGLFRLAEMPALGNPDLVTVALKVPAGIVCLVSALAFHRITTQIPHEASIALRHHTERPRLTYPPIRVYWFSDATIAEGVETHTLDRVPVRIFGPEKTLADCVKYRNKIGLDIVLEAMKMYRQLGRMKIDRLMAYARVCRVERIMRPYLEILV
jgi:predicted transcriptional regulator of viral defense system